MKKTKEEGNKVRKKKGRKDKNVYSGATRCDAPTGWRKALFTGCARAFLRNNEDQFR
jgi:hypothetical protein